MMAELFGETDIIVERNRTYEVAEYAKGYVAVGSTGSGTKRANHTRMCWNKLF